MYVDDVESSVARPRRELKGFTKLTLEPGETATANITLDRRAFAFWDVAAAGWTVEPGEFAIAVGSSSRAIRGGASCTAYPPAERAARATAKEQ